ncbi:MAG TPA: histidine kinase dimerization/phospho-acceptor domain-containing protein [Acidobacteriota bacterium]|nr:histidine kinase dimerization/phospho-acceptor domain-containing protein [Acidobacteriota bacterium]
MFKRIGSRVLALFVLSVAVLVVLLGFVFYFIGARSLEKQVDSNLKSTATVLASQWDGSLLMLLKPGMENAPLFQSFSQRILRMKEQAQVHGIYIATPERKHILSTESSIRIGQALPRLDLLQGEMKEALKGTAAVSSLVRVGNHQYKSAIAPVYAGDRVAAVLMVDMSPWYLVYLKSFRNSLLLFTLLALVGAAILARIFSRTITEPISKMVERVDEIGRARYEDPLEISGTDELGRLGSAIETMRQNIHRRDAQMRMMLSGVAHEIRNPLGGIELFAGILEKENLSAEQREYLRKIQWEIQQLKRLLNEFLDFARPRNLQYEKVELSGLMEEIRNLVSNDIETRKAHWTVEVQPDLSLIEADRSKLRQALLNLYRNAFQSIPDTGDVSSTIRRNGAGVVVEISNTQQRKLDPEVERRIFEPFYTTREKGIGLGLPLAKRIIEAHGGEIKLAENSDSKITFAVKLPGVKRENATW